MSKEIRLPALGENVEAAQVLAVLVAAGDTITKDQALIEVETDKATAEVPSPLAGVVETIHVNVGDEVGVNQLVVTLATSEDVAQEEASPPAPADPAPKPPAIPAPQLASAPSPSAPSVEPPARGPSVHLVAVPAPGASRSEVARSIPAAPSVRRLARELGVEIDDVRGSGPGERISLDDVKAHVRAALASRGGGMRSPRPRAGTTGEAGPPEREAMSGIRRKIAENMTKAWNRIPHVTQFDRADITELEVWRKQAAKKVEARGGKLTVTAILVRLAASALRSFPKFNASVDMDTGEIVNHQEVNIGLAVETERGLLVPVVRAADRKSVFEVAAEVTSLATRARDRKIGLEDLRGGTFSITNLGGLGTTYFSPIVNWPEVAVLGVGRAEIQAVYQDGGFQPRLHLPLSLSYDHRLIDGADAARFLRWIAEAMEHPLLAL